MYQMSSILYMYTIRILYQFWQSLWCKLKAKHTWPIHFNPSLRLAPSPPPQAFTRHLTLMRTLQVMTQYSYKGFTLSKYFLSDSETHTQKGSSLRPITVCYSDGHSERKIPFIKVPVTYTRTRTPNKDRFCLYMCITASLLRIYISVWKFE